MFTSSGIGIDAYVKIESDGYTDCAVVDGEIQFRVGGPRSTGVTLVFTVPSLEKLVVKAAEMLDELRTKTGDSQTPTSAA